MTPPEAIRPLPLPKPFHRRSQDSMSNAHYADLRKGLKSDQPTSDGISP